MKTRGSLAGALFVLLSLGTSVSHAQCSKDIDCKGDRVCDAGKCVTEPPPAPAAPAGSESAPQPPAPAAAAPVAPAPAPTPVYVAVAPSADAAKVKPKRHSTGMMVAGIVMVSVAPIFLVSALMAASVCTYEEAYDDPYASNCGDDTAAIALTVVGIGLVGGGIPLIVIGAKREPAKATATLSPWANPHGAGASLRLEL